jgi:hypothetical protein
VRHLALQTYFQQFFSKKSSFDGNFQGKSIDSRMVAASRGAQIVLYQSFTHRIYHISDNLRADLVFLEHRNRNTAVGREAAGMAAAGGSAAQD